MSRSGENHLSAVSRGVQLVEQYREQYREQYGEQRYDEESEA